MISIIIVGLNEGYFLNDCLRSVVKFSSENQQEFEIIYVDSGSTDDSIKHALSYKDVKVVQLTKDANSAIARNVGANIAKGIYLVFLDADMIIQKHFAEKYLKSEVFEENIFFSGDILNYYYDKKGKFLGKEYYWRKPLPKDRIESKTGGLFCIKQSVFRKYNGMKNYYRRTQDNEFGLRLASKGIKMLRFKELFVIHQTISYTNYYRLVKIILNGDFL